MKLIAENEMGNIISVNEAKDAQGEKSMFIEGIFAQAEKQNRNKRTYPKKVLSEAVQKYIADYVSKSKAIGELNHPQAFAPNPERACILIKELAWDGNDVLGKAKVLSTPQGEIVKSLLRDGVQLGVSTRGMGSLEEKGDETVVKDDYVISAIDVVSNPSGIDCWVDGVLENVEYYWRNGVLVESTAEEYLKHKKMSDTRVLKEDFAKFINELNF
jgi:Prohead core protein protease.